MTTNWRLSALDTLFFRDSRPHGAAGAAVLGSLFPPSIRTVAGLLRFLIGTALGADWHRFGSTPDGSPYHVGGVDLLALIGRYDTYGALRFSGPWLVIETASGWRRLYPAPRTLLTDPEQKLSGFLAIGASVDCDLGRLRLPHGAAGQRSAEGLWLDAEAYAQALRGELPTGWIFSATDLYDEEPRLGIARTLAQHTATPGMLYQTRHVRPRSHGRSALTGKAFSRLAIEVGLDAGNHEISSAVPLARLGGEGRLVEVCVEARAAVLPKPPEPGAHHIGLTLSLMTPADLGGRFMPPGFESRTEGDATVWRGTIHGIPLVIHSAAIGKAMREGGWDLAARKPRAVRSLVPAGSTWYATVIDDRGTPVRGPALASAIHALHGTQLDDDALGRGQIAVGVFGADTAPFLEVS